MILNNQQVTEEIKIGNQKISRNKWQRNHNSTKPMGYSKSSSKREVYSNTILSQETRKHQIDYSISKEAGKRRRKKTTKSQKETNHKDQSRNKWKRYEGNNSKD